MSFLISFALSPRSPPPYMEHIEKTVFLSYRRTNAPWALAIFQSLTHHGYNVFFDFSGIASGDFERVIIGNIKARAHFLVLLTPSGQRARKRRLVTFVTETGFDSQDYDAILRVPPGGTKLISPARKRLGNRFHYTEEPLRGQASANVDR